MTRRSRLLFFDSYFKTSGKTWCVFARVFCFVFSLFIAHASFADKAGSKAIRVGYAGGFSSFSMAGDEGTWSASGVSQQLLLQYRLGVGKAAFEIIGLFGRGTMSVSDLDAAADFLDYSSWAVGLNLKSGLLSAGGGYKSNSFDADDSLDASDAESMSQSSWYVVGRVDLPIYENDVHIYAQGVLSFGSITETLTTTDTIFGYEATVGLSFKLPTSR